MSLRVDVSNVTSKPGLFRRRGVHRDLPADRQFCQWASLAVQGPSFLFSLSSSSLVSNALEHVAQPAFIISPYKKPLKTLFPSPSQHRENLTPQKYWIHDDVPDPWEEEN